MTTPATHHARLAAIEDYHRLIADDLASAEAQMDLLMGLQHERHVLFGNRPMAHSLRPVFLTEAMYTEVQDVVYLIRQAILRVAAAHFNDERVLREELGMHGWEIELAAIPTNVVRLSALARMDSFMTADSFKFVEVNGESPAGIAYVHQLGRIYQELPVFQAFTRQHPVRFVSPLEHTIASLLLVYHEQWGGREEHPTFAIVDKGGVPTIHEFHLVQQYLEKHGYPCVVAEPQELEIHDGWVYAQGRRIDVLYRRLLLNEYYAEKERFPAFLEGYRAGKTCYLNTFRSKLVHKKAIFAFLTDERYTRSLTHAQRVTVAHHIPWTRMLREGHTRFRGLDIDLVSFVRNNRAYFVIKPNDEYGGAGVHLGFDSTQGEWDDALALSVGQDFVVQEAVHIHREPFLVQTGNGWEQVPTVVDLDPYINGPLMGGCLTRTSASNLANVTAGGGTLPLFILRSTH